jgi:magnesium-transporting ATPase (P-type)
MLTGDQRGTAEAIARELELGGDTHALPGDEVDTLSDSELKNRLATATVLSRAVLQRSCAWSKPINGVAQSWP